MAASLWRAGRGWGPGAPGNVPLLPSPTTASLDVLQPFRCKTNCSAVNATTLSDPPGKKSFRSLSAQLSRSEG